jgi:hypothetical protein
VNNKPQRRTRPDLGYRAIGWMDGWMDKEKHKLVAVWLRFCSVKFCLPEKVRRRNRHLYLGYRIEFTE